MKTVRRISSAGTTHLYVFAAVLLVAIMGVYGFTLSKVSPITTPLSNTTSEQQPAPAPIPLDATGARELVQAQRPDRVVSKVVTVPALDGTPTTYNVVFTDGSAVNVDAVSGNIADTKNVDPDATHTSSTDTTSDPSQTTPTDTPTDQDPEQSPETQSTPESL